MPFLTTTGEEIKKVYGVDEPVEDNIYMVVGVDYNGYEKKMVGNIEIRGCAIIKLYDIMTGEIKFWNDNTNHLPYMLAIIRKGDGEDYYLIKERVESNIILNPEKSENIIFFESIIKKNPLIDEEEEEYVKVVAGDPLTIGDLRRRMRDENIKEGKIRYYKCYTYDEKIEIGLMYKIVDDKLIKVDTEIDDKIRKFFKERIELKTDDEIRVFSRMLKSFFVKIPTFKKVLGLDIEVYNVGVTPKEFKTFAEDGNYPIVTISFVSDDGMMKVFSLNIKGRKRGNKEEIIKKMKKQYQFNYKLDDVEFEFFDSEKRMLENTFEIIDRYSIVCTFNGDEFDFRYIYNRAMNKYGFKKWQFPFIMRDFMGKHTINLKNGIHIDEYHFIGENQSIRTYALRGKLKFKSLDHAGEKLLDERKLDVSMDDIDKYDDYELGFYCLQDSYITYKLMTYNNQMLLKLVVMLMRLTTTTMDDLCRYQISNWLHNMMDCYHRYLNMVIPNPIEIRKKVKYAHTKAKVKGKKFQGAIVVQPKLGVHFNVVCLDFGSLYPTVIKDWNLSYETVNCGHDECIECETNKIPETKHYYCIKRRGIFSLLIGLIRDFRLYYFKEKAKNKDKSLTPEEEELYKTIEQALKVIMNASYGVEGSEEFYYFSLPVAESTTAIARYSTKKLIKKCEEMGIFVIYGDTDSVFLYEPTEEQINNLIGWSFNELGIELGIDYEFIWCAFSERKKNYVGLGVDGELSIKGLTGKKKHVPEFLKNIFNLITQLLISMRNQRDVLDTVNLIKGSVRDMLNKFYKRRFELEDLVYRVELHRDIEDYKGNPPHVKVAMMLQNSGEDVKAGDTIEYIKTTGKHSAKPLKFVRRHEVNTKQYEREMKSMLEQVLDCFNINWSEVKGQISKGQFENMLGMV